MNYTFPAAVEGNKKNPIYEQLPQLVIQGSRLTYLVVQGAGHILLQHWEVGQSQLRLISMNSDKKEVFSFRSDAEESLFIFCLDGKLILQDHVGGIRRLQNHHGLILAQDHFQGFCTMNAGRATCQILLISLKKNERENSIQANTNPVFAFSPLLTTQIEKLLFTSFVNLKPFHQELVESIAKAAKEIVLLSSASVQMNEEELSLLSAFKNYLDTNVGKQISVFNWSQNNGITVRRLGGAFKNLYGKTVRVYLRELKLSSSKEAVCYSKKSLKQISKEAGYHSYSNFSSAFRIYFGQTPALMRKTK